MKLSQIGHSIPVGALVLHSGGSDGPRRDAFGEVGFYEHGWQSAYILLDALKEFTGVSDPYEPPTSAELTSDAGRDTVDHEAESVLTIVTAARYVV